MATIRQFISMLQGIPDEMQDENFRIYGREIHHVTIHRQIPLATTKEPNIQVGFAVRTEPSIELPFYNIEYNN